MALTLDGTTGITTSGSSSSGAGGISTNTALGGAALGANTTGSNNTAVGYQALDANTTGTQNTAIGTGALGANISGTNNTAVGYNALLVNTGNANTAIGHNSGAALTSGGDNTALGLQSLYVNTTGNSNTALGVQALASNTTASFNTAVGRYALNANTTASYNTAVGYEAGYSQTTAEYNTFIGYRAGKSTTGDQNTFLGKFAGNLITTGTLNTIIGAYNGNQGGLDIRTASNYIVLSDGGGTPRGFFDNNGDWIVNGPYANPPTDSFVKNTASGIIQAGRTGTGSQPMAEWFNGNGVVGSIYTSGSSTTYNTSSDYRLKNSIELMTGALAKVATLKPVTYKWNADGSSGEGFIAHELQEVVPYAVTGEKDGEEMQGVDYGKLTPILTAALQEAIAKIETLEARIAVLEAK